MENKASPRASWKLGATLLISAFGGIGLTATHFGRLLSGPLAHYSKAFLVMSLAFPVSTVFNSWFLIDPVRTGRTTAGKAEKQMVYLLMIPWTMVFSLLTPICLGFFGASLKLSTISPGFIFGSSVLLFVFTLRGLVKEAWTNPGLVAKNIGLLFVLGYGLYASLLGPYMFFFP